MKQILMVGLLLLVVTACSSESMKKETKIREPYKAEFKGKEMNNSIFGEKPYYKIEIEGTNAKFSVAINGLEIYKDFSGENCYTKRPINEMVTSGDNELQVNIYTQIHQYNIRKNTKVNVKLLLSSSITKKTYELGSINFDNSLDNKIIKSNGKKETMIEDKGMYQSEKIVRSLISEQLVSGRKGEKASGIELKQTISFRTPFPRWKFLDSEEISSTLFCRVNENEAYENFRHSETLKGLYQAYQQLHGFLEDADVTSFVEMFSERSAEMEYAYYREKGHNKKLLSKGIIEELKDENLKLADFSYTPSKNFFVLEPNRKVASLLGQIAFNKIKGKGSTAYTMQFRMENGEWILTR